MEQPGRKQANAVVRQLVAACQAAGLSVSGKMARMMPDRQDRIIQVDASPSGSEARFISVSISPGSTLFNRTPVPCSSAAHVRVR